MDTIEKTAIIESTLEIKEVELTSLKEKLQRIENICNECMYHEGMKTMMCSTIFEVMKTK